MKLIKKTIGKEDVYFENGVKKYTYSKNSDGYEYWKEYDKNNNQIHYKDSGGGEYWSDENPKSRGVEVDIEPFTFTTEKTMNKTLQEREAEAREAYDEANRAWNEAEEARDEANRVYDEAGKAYEKTREAYMAICREIEEERKKL